MTIEADRFKVDEMRKEHYQKENKEKLKAKFGLKSQVISKMESKVLNEFDQNDMEDGFENEGLMATQINKIFTLKESNASFDIRNV